MPIGDDVGGKPVLNSTCRMDRSESVNQCIALLPPNEVRTAKGQRSSVDTSSFGVVRRVGPPDTYSSLRAFLSGRAYDAHDIGRGAAVAQFRRHEVHEWVYVVKEVFIAGAKVVQPGFAVPCLEEAMLRAFPIARESDFAFTAGAWQRGELVVAEALLL